jgi:D-lactate dehydrogenase (cytochrome)
MAGPSGLIGPQGLIFLAEVVGAENVSTGESVLDLHGRDSSYPPAVRPEAVAWPTTTAQVSQILAWADREVIPVTPWGAGTSLEGNPIPVAGGLVLDMTKMNRILELREEDMQVDVEPGVGYKDLNHALRHKGLFFPPDPGAWATIGGMIANNASGVRTVKYGCTRDYVQALEVVLPGGEVIVTGTRARKSSAGYYLTGLFVGSEGTLGVVTRATLKLAGLPEHFLAAVAAFDSVERAAEAVATIIRAGLGPAALEIVTAPMVRVMNRADNLTLPEKDLLFMEFTSFSEAGLAELLGQIGRASCRERVS